MSREYPSKENKHPVQQDRLHFLRAEECTFPPAGDDTPDIPKTAMHFDDLGTGVSE